MRRPHRLKGIGGSGDENGNLWVNLFLDSPRLKGAVLVPRTFSCKMAAIFSPKGFGFSGIIIASVVFMSHFSERLQSHYMDF